MTDKNLSDFLPDKKASYFKEFKIKKFEKKIIKDQVVDELRKVMDPEIPVNLYDLGLIYSIKIDINNNILIEMTLTNPNCPVAGTMPESVGLAVEKIPNLSSIKVGLVWYPKWNKNMMSEDAKLALDIF
jgi:FeS assembly SUF system protein